MARYVDGFVVPVKTARIADYRRLARTAGMDTSSMPFDGKRMFWGGFKELVAMGS